MIKASAWNKSYTTSSLSFGHLNVEIEISSEIDEPRWSLEFGTIKSRENQYMLR